jgi:hypothetical protein
MRSREREFDWTRCVEEMGINIMWLGFLVVYMCVMYLLLYLQLDKCLANYNFD